MLKFDVDRHVGKIHCAYVGFIVWGPMIADQAKTFRTLSEAVNGFQQVPICKVLPQSFGEYGGF